tara:strand:+ start:612 stop:734 length:123 start_codon:yes stop_codon:yes gene_type:complete
MMEKGIDESALFMARSRVDHHAGRFVDHNEVRIVVDDSEW